MKVAGEIIHEVLGHGVTVYLFGGIITRVHIALLWPYKLSYIHFKPPIGGFTPWELIWIYASGILACLILSIILQITLHLRFLGWRVSTTLFWLSFWTYVNPAGYLIMGGVKPFGDIIMLINLGALSQASSLLLGLTVFLPGLLSLSKILYGLLINVGVVKVKECIICFWLLLIPGLLLIAALGLHMWF